ncbi:MAG: TldD/PmbA family protein [Thermoleophilaceae bacterium]
MTDPLALAESALDAVGPADGALVRVVAERSLFLRFAASRPTQSTSLDDLTVEVVAVRDGHVGVAATNGAGRDAVETAARSARVAAEAAARDGAPGSYPGPPESGEVRGPRGHDPATARLDSDAGAAAMTAAFEACDARGVEAHGVWTAGEVRTAVASSSGAALLDEVTDAFMKVTAIVPGGRSGYASAAGVAASEIDARGVAQRAVEKATAGGEPRRLEPGEYPVVLEPAAVGQLLQHLGDLAFNGLSYSEGRSALSDRLGQLVAAPRINIADSPRHPRTLPRAFDAEGVAKAPLPLIQDGVAHRVVHDARSAALAGARSTGHALAPGGGAGGPLPTNLVLTGGAARSTEELCRPIERGVYVTRLWYTNPVRPKETLLTGLTRDGTFLIENGAIAGPLEDMRMTERILAILERTEDLTAEPELWSEGEFYGRRFATGVVCPALRASAVRFTA